jgi:uncharacterized protein YhaN
VILRKLKLENYGIFTDKELIFPDGNLVVMYGPNEAGKTTLLHSIRESFFGFKSKLNPYMFGSEKMASEVNLLMRDGKEINYRRMKVKKIPVFGEIIGSTIELDEEKLLQIFGNINSDIYWNIFGFSLSELAQGEESLKNKEITEVLYGSGMGGVTNIDEIKSQIVAEEEIIFKSRSTNPRLNKLIKRIKEKEKEMREYIIVPSNYTSEVREIKNKEKAKNEMEEGLTKAKRRMDHIENLLEAYEPFLNIKNDRLALNKISIPPNLPQDMKSTYNEATKEMNRLGKELKRLWNEIQDLERNRDAISFSQNLIDEKPLLETLFSEMRSIESCHRDIPKIETQSKMLQRDITDGLKGIDSTWDMDFLESFTADITVRNEFDNLIKAYGVLDKNLVRLNDRIMSLDNEIADINSNLKEEGEEKDPTPFEELQESSSEYKSDKKENLRLSKDNQALEKNEKSIWKKLAPLVKEGQEIDYPVPMEKTIKRYEKELEKKKIILDRLKHELESQERQLIDEKEDLSALVETKVRVDRKNLSEMRNHRDKGWELIKKEYIKSKKKVSQEDRKEWMGDKHTDLSGAYEEAVKESDLISDQLYANSESVTKKEDLEKRIRKQKKLILDTEKRITQIEGEIADITSKWNEEWDEEWKDCGFIPHTPMEMKEWVNNQQALLQILKEKSQINTHMDGLKKNIDRFLEEARVHFPRITEKNVATTMKKVEKEIQEARDSNTRIKQLSKDLRKKQKDFQKREEEKKKLEKKADEWKKEWTTLLKKMQFYTDWDTDTADKVLRTLDNSKQKMKEDKENHFRIRDMENTVDEYLKKVEELVKRLKWKRMDRKNPEKTVKELYSILSEEQEKAQARKELENKIEDRNAELNRMKKECQENEKTINNLFTRVGVGNDDEFLSLASQVEQAWKLEAQIEKNTEYLNRLRLKEDISLEVLIDELNDTDFTVIEIEKEELKTKIDEMKEEWEQHLREYIALEQDFKKFDGSGKAAEIANEVEFLRAEFDTNMDRYISLVMARRLLEEAVNRFEKEHQPELLNIINGIFEKITDGRYTQIKASLDKENPFHVVDSDGNKKTPKQLSTGTREQLYLAIRLGYIEHYGRKVEPLPIIMDDVLVNFDDTRARNTAMALVDIARDKQIIVMTCHENTVKTFQDANKDIPIMEM